MCWPLQAPCQFHPVAFRIACYRVRLPGAKSASSRAHFTGKPASSRTAPKASRSALCLTSHPMKASASGVSRVTTSRYYVRPYESDFFHRATLHSNRVKLAPVIEFVGTHTQYANESIVIAVYVIRRNLFALFKNAAQ